MRSLLCKTDLNIDVIFSCLYCTQQSCGGIAIPLPSNLSWPLEAQFPSLVAVPSLREFQRHHWCRTVHTPVSETALKAREV